MPSGISVQPSTTDVAPRAARLRTTVGERRIGVRHAVQLHQRNGRADQPIHLVLAGHDAVPSLCAKAVLVKPHRQRRLGRHHAASAGCETNPAQLRRRGIDDMQDRHLRRIAHGIVPAVRGVARDGDRAAARALKALDAVQQPGQRIRLAARLRDRSVRHPRVGPQHRRDMVLVARRRRQLREPHHELCAGQRAHAAKHAQHLSHRPA